MFVINNETVFDEFNKSSWDHDYCKFCEIVHPSHSKITAAERAFANDFSDKMIAAYELCRDFPEEISGYFSIRDMLVENNLTPEDIEYGVFGNICAGVISFGNRNEPPSDETDDAFFDKMDTMTSFGYIPAVEKIVSNDPYTIIIFADGTQTTVKVDEKDTFDAKTGILTALLKKAMGSRNLQHIFRLISGAIDSVPVTADNISEPEIEFEGDDGSMEYESVDDWYNDWNKDGSPKE